jgi:arsenite methyltransferase
MGSTDVLEQARAKACCADLYQSELARIIIGDTLHPGGLALTNQMAKLLEIQPGGWVADLASARGASAMAVSRVFKCQVVGVEFGRGAVAQAQAAAQSSSTATRSYAVQGDAERPPLRGESMDAVFCECAMSLFPDKPRAVTEVVNLLRPGGRFGLSDVTVEPDSLPKELNGTLSQLLCLTDALNVPGYVRLLENSVLNLVHQIDASIEAHRILDALDAKLGAFMAWQKLTSRGSPQFELLQQAPELLSTLRDLVAQGRISYWIFVAEKPVANSHPSPN